MELEASVRRLVWQRAANRCEYCRLPASCDVIPFCVDHIVPQKHRGKTLLENLALACLPCNSFKLDNLTGLDPQSNLITQLFHPRLDVWSRHFRWKAAELGGLTDIGRTTIEVLRINLRERVEHRELLMLLGSFPLP